MKTHKKKKHPSVSSKVKKLPKMDWGPSDKNRSTLKKIEKSIQEEKDALHK